MLENYLILGYLTVIIIFQSIIGVGILVLGTPFLLILKYSIVEIFFILLPISIITSFLNLLIINFSNKYLDKSTKEETKKFIFICIPSIFVGLVILKLLNDFLNFKLLVSFVIFFSIAIAALKNKINFRISFFRISILSIVGIIHGLTNSGGTLMSLALSANNNKSYSRLNTSFFYLILATFQYLLTIIIFFDKFTFLSDYKLIIVIMLGVIIGNVFNCYLDDKIFKIIVNSLAVFSASMLLFF